MNQEFCQRESLVVAAVRSGSWPMELEEHVAACAACAATRRVSQVFREHAAAASRTQPQPANLVWQRLQSRRQQVALKRATQCVALMCVLAAVYAIALGAWYLPELWHARLVTEIGPLSSGVAEGVLAAILAVLIGSCCFAFLGSRTDFRLRS